MPSNQFSLPEGLDSQLISVLRDSPLAMTIFRGPDFIVEMATKAYLQIVDRSETEFVGRSLFDSLPEVRSAVEPLLTNVYRTGIPYYGNEFQVTLNRYGESTTAFFNFVYHPSRDADGNIIGIIVLANEVTSLVLAKRALSESERKFRNLVMQSPIAVTVFKGEDFVIELANEKMLTTLWRKKKEDVIGKQLLEVFPELRDQKYPELLAAVYREGIVHSEKESLAFVQGDDGMRQFYLDFSYDPLFDDDGRVFGVIAHVTDVTDRVESRQRIERAEERSRLAIDSADLGTYEYNFVTHEMRSSNRFQTMWGIDEGLGRNDIAAFIHPDDQPERIRAHELALTTGTLAYEARLARNGNVYAWIKVRGTVLFDAQSKPLTLVGVVQDITEQKMFASELERQVQERTEELMAANEEIVATNEELSEANNNLTRANIDLEQFNYAASHDLQEPLRKIQTFADLLLSLIAEDETSKPRNLINKIASAADRMRSIIDDLLLYAHHDRADRQYEPTDLNKVIGAIRNDLELIIEQKSAIIEAGTLPVAKTIPGQMHQLFLNLISNSLKFTKDGIPPLIRIGSRPLNPDIQDRFRLTGLYHHISVTDNGIGFHPEHADYVFQLFKRLHSRKEYNGTGIGLALCKRIVENHHGRIFAESVEGHGTIMHIILPADK